MDNKVVLLLCMCTMYQSAIHLFSVQEHKCFFIFRECYRRFCLRGGIQRIIFFTLDRAIMDIRIPILRANV